MHRIATSERFHVSPHEVRDHWTWREAVEAHELLDAFERATRGAK